MPRGYGQLGCSGFIVSDDNGCFVTRKSPAYLQYGEGAFRHVESLLSDLLQSTETKESPKRQKRGLMKNEEEKKEEKKVCQPIEEAKKKMKDLKEKIKPPPSVGVDAMDDEHQECTDSFNKVIENPTADNLLDLYNVLKEHFDHEEKLMMEYSETKSDDSSSFSAINSHKNDHDRILNIAKEELDRLNVCEYKTKK